MYRATLSFTTKDYDIRKNQILAEDFTTQDEIDEFLRIGYIVVYDGTLEITQNGLYDVDGYQQADVDVAGGQATLQEKSVTITQNGETTITADTGYDGLSEVGLNVTVPAPQPSLQDKQVSVTSNTTTTIQADSQYDGLGTVEVTTNVPTTDSYAKMYTNFNSKDFTSMEKVTGWSKGFEAGDYQVQTAYSRIKIQNTTLLQICGNCGGYGASFIEYHLKNSQGQDILNDYSRSCLIQSGGNGYWINALATFIVELNPSETYYLELGASGYNTTFKMNDGFSSSATWLSAIKLK